MKKLYMTLICAMATLAFAIPGHAKEKQPYAVVNFATCISDSKYGKQEQENFEALKKQMHKAVEDLDKQLNETITKIQDADYIDSLSPEGEQELRVKYQNLNEELQRYQAQYYQALQQANMKLIQTLHGHINTASSKIATKENIDLVLNKETAFHFSPALDITAKVVTEMDKAFDVEKKQAKK